MTFPTSVIRRLARSEEMFAQSQTYFGATVRLIGSVDTAAMAMAFDTLLDAHPILAGHLERRADGLHHIVADDLLHPGIWLLKGEDATPTARMRLDQRVSVTNLRLRLVDGSAELTLFTHHSLADAQHQFGLLSELFAWYTDLVTTGDTGPVIVAQTPEPIEAVLAERGVVKQSRSGFERLLAAMYVYELPPSTKSDAGGSPDLPAPVPVARCQLTESQTAALATFCTSYGLSLNSAVSAAILTAEWQIRATPHIPIPYLYPVDLRLLLTPPVDPTASTNPLGVATYLAKITADTELADLARDIVETFRADLADGLIQQSILHFDLQYEGNPPGLPDVVIASNGGVLPSMPTPPGLRVDGVYSELFTASAAGIDLYAISVFDDRLHIEHHAHTPAPERAIDAIHALLCSVDDDSDWMAE